MKYVFFPLMNHHKMLVCLHGNIRNLNLFRKRRRRRKDSSEKEKYVYEY
jgi:hypothetical protein